MAKGWHRSAPKQRGGTSRPPAGTSGAHPRGSAMKFEHRAVPIALAAVLIDTIGFGIIMPVFPKLITTLGHIDLEHATRVAGWLLVIFSFTQFIAGPILGNLSDRFGRRPVLIASMLSFGVDYA